MAVSLILQAFAVVFSLAAFTLGGVVFTQLYFGRPGAVVVRARSSAAAAAVRRALAVHG